MSDGLDLIWRRADIENHVLEQAEIAHWPQAEREAILHLGLIRRTIDTTTLTCEDCGEPHPSEVIRDPRRPESPYYLCPRIGRIPTSSEAIRRWEVDFDRLAALIRKATGLGGKATTLVPSRVWLLGRQQQASGFWEVFLVRGVCWPDGLASLDQCLRLQQSPAPIILVPRRLPSVQSLGTRSWTIRALSEVANIEGSRLAIDDHDLSAAALAAQAVSALSRPRNTPKRLPRSIGTPEAVNAAVEYMQSKGLTETQFGNQFQSTDRTVRSFRRTGKLRRSAFKAMAESMDLTIEELLRGKLPPSTRRSDRG